MVGLWGCSTLLGFSFGVGVSVCFPWVLGFTFGFDFVFRFVLLGFLMLDYFRVDFTRGFWYLIGWVIICCLGLLYCDNTLVCN